MTSYLLVVSPALEGNIKNGFFYLALILYALIFLAALRVIVKREWPFLEGFDGTHAPAYTVLAIIAAIAFVYAEGWPIHSLEIGGVKVTLAEVAKKVDDTSELVKALYALKKVESFDEHNWDRVRKVGKRSEGGFTVEITLEEPPIPGSVEVFEGPLYMPETDYRIDGSKLRFPANTDKPTSGLTISYHPMPVLEK